LRRPNLTQPTPQQLDLIIQNKPEENVNHTLPNDINQTTNGSTAPELPVKQMHLDEKGDETDSFPSSTSSLSSDPKIKLLHQRNDTPPLRDLTSNFERA
jgi:hypothetical protein